MQYVTLQEVEKQYNCTPLMHISISVQYFLS